MGPKEPDCCWKFQDVFVLTAAKEKIQVLFILIFSDIIGTVGNL